MNSSFSQILFAFAGAALCAFASSILSVAVFDIAVPVGADQIRGSVRA